jgi:putative tryptophan/tyrosine transport system substrate-binding protein
MRRREFIIRIAGLSAAWPLIAHAQQSQKMAKIGVLWHAGSAEEEKVYLSMLTKALGDLGYVEGKNIVFSHRFPAEQPDRYRSLARELVESNVDVIVAITEPGAVALKQITSTIPIVFGVVADPVGSGFVASLAHPGGNLTGLSFMATDLTGKRLSLLKEAIPSLSRVALLQDRSLGSVASTTNLELYSKAAGTMGLILDRVEVPTPDAIDGAFSVAAEHGCQAAILFGGMLANEGMRVGASALAHGVPTLSVWSEKVGYGLLMSYGQDVDETFRKLARYVDQILRGAKPADLPVEQPTRLKLVINLKAAKVLGLTMPVSLLTAADEVIE